MLCFHRTLYDVAQSRGASFSVLIFEICERKKKISVKVTFRFSMEFIFSPKFHAFASLILMRTSKKKLPTSIMSTYLWFWQKMRTNYRAHFFFPGLFVFEKNPVTKINFRQFHQTRINKICPPLRSKYKTELKKVLKYRMRLTLTRVMNN